MTFRRYDNLETFREDVLDILLEDELCNNLPVSIISDVNTKNTDDWLMGTVIDDSGTVVLTVLCVRPFNLLLYEPDSIKGKAVNSVKQLADELHRIGFIPPGVFAKTELARQFAVEFVASYKGSFKEKTISTMMLMKLDKLSSYKKANGFCRSLTEDDLTFVPFWEQAFCLDCHIPAFSLDENRERIKTRIDKDLHFIWEDGLPVSQAVNGRDTPNGAVINWVYTPPLYRGCGYATSVVAKLVQSLLSRGKKYCCLFADVANPASCAVYRKLGFYDVCEFEEIHFS